MTTLERGLAWADAHRAEALDLVRIFLGLGLLVRGALFLANPDAYLALVPETSSAFVVSRAVYHLVSLAHVIGGLLLAAGLLTRLAALVQIPVLAGAAALHATAGPLAGGQSFEFAALVLVLLVVFALWGSGPLSLDRWLALKNEEEETREARIVEETAARLHAPPVEPAPDRAPVPSAVRPAGRPAALPTCSCGHDRYHPHVAPKRYYGLRGALPFFSGATGTPTRIVFRCRDCGEVVEDTTDRAVMRQFRYRRYATPDHPDWTE